MWTKKLSVSCFFLLRLKTALSPRGRGTLPAHVDSTHVAASAHSSCVKPLCISANAQWYHAAQHASVPGTAFHIHKCCLV